MTAVGSGEISAFLRTHDKSRIFAVVPDTAETRGKDLSGLVPRAVPDAENLLLLDTRPGALSRSEWLRKLIAALIEADYSSLDRRLRARRRRRLAGIVVSSLLIGAIGFVGFDAYSEYQMKRVVEERALNVINRGYQVDGAPLAVLAASPPHNPLLKLVGPSTQEAVIASGFTTQIVATSDERYSAQHLIQLNSMPVAFVQNADGDVRIIRSDTGDILHTVKGVTESGWRISDNDRLFLFTIDGGGYTIASLSQDKIQTMDLGSAYSSAFMNKTGDWIMTVSDKGTCERIRSVNGGFVTEAVKTNIRCASLREAAHGTNTVAFDDQSNPFIIKNDLSVVDIRNCDFVGIGDGNVGHCLTRRSAALFDIDKTSNRMKIQTSAAISKVIYGTASPNVMILTKAGEILIVDFSTKKILYHEMIGRTVDSDIIGDVLYHSAPNRPTLVKIRTPSNMIVYNVDSAKKIGEYPANFFDHFESSRDRSLYGFSTSDGPVFDAQTGKKMMSLVHPGDHIDSLTFSPDGAKVAFDVEGGYGGIMDVATRQLLVRFPYPDEDGGNEGRFSRDSSIYISNDADDGADVWDARSGAMLARLAPNDGAGLIDTNNDGAIIETANTTGQLIVWHLDKKRSFDASTAYDRACALNHAFVHRIPVADRRRLHLPSRVGDPCRSRL
jgi:hypothetical protein